MKSREILVKKEYAKFFGKRVVVKKYCYDSSDWSLCGEYITYYENGILMSYGFCRESHSIGLWKYYNVDGKLREVVYYSLRKGELGEIISDLEYKKQIALLRLGGIECPEFDILINDYE